MNIFTIESEMLFTILSGKISTAINRKLHRSFRKMNIDITPEQWTVLRYLWTKEGVTQQELCNATFKDKPSMTRLIDNLEKQRLVTRSSDSNDRRINIIHLTQKGKDLENITQPLIAEAMNIAAKNLSSEEIQLAGILLNKVFHNIKESLDD